MPRRLSVALSVAFALIVAGLPISSRGAARNSKLPARLADRDFWQLIVYSLEPNGYFRSDNLTSNELGYQKVIPDLVRRARPDRVYLGVGPATRCTRAISAR